MISPPSPSRAFALDTSPPVSGGEDGRQAELPSSPPHSGGEVSRAKARDGEGDDNAGRSRRSPGTTDRARSMRKRGTKPEALLWIELKACRLGGFHFTRQFPIGPYYADFACRSEGLVVELDGSQHANSPTDRARDQFIQSAGYSILRFWNDDVLRQRRSVCETILAALLGQLSSNVNTTDLRFIFAPNRDAHP